MATAGVSLLERGKRYQEGIDRLHQLLGGPLLLQPQGSVLAAARRAARTVWSLHTM